jgi:DNA-binding NtrC family response regulator
MKWSILYFDEDLVLLDIFEEMFRREYEVRTVATLSRARQLLSETPFDIIISDLSMPEISGVDFLREVARKYSSSIRVLVTDYATAGDMLPEISNGVVQFFLAKPWREEEMDQVIRRAVASMEEF